MDSLLKAFSIGFLLRSVFAGIFFVVAYYVASDGVGGTVIEAKSISSPALLVALFAGVFVYGVHRSVVYPFIEWFFNSNAGKDCRKSKPLISPSTIQTLLYRWNQNAHGPIDRERVNKHFNGWADFIHLQFTSSLCIGLGAWVGWIIASDKPKPYCPLIVLGVLLFVAAFGSNWRSHSVLDYVRKLPQAETVPPERLAASDLQR